MKINWKLYLETAAAIANITKFPLIFPFVNFFAIGAGIF